MAIDHRQLELLERLRLDAATDYLGLWNVYKIAAEEYGLMEPNLHEFVIEIVGRMMETGFLIGAFTGPQKQFALWPNQEPRAVVERLAEEWQSPRIPDFGDPWFDYPKKAEAE